MDEDQMADPDTCDLSYSVRDVEMLVAERTSELVARANQADAERDAALDALAALQMGDAQSIGRWIVLADGDLAYKPVDGGGAWPFRYLDVHPFITLEGWNALVDLVAASDVSVGERDRTYTTGKEREVPA